MKKLITILLLLASVFAVAQPGGYVAGTQVSWNPNGRDMGYFKPVGWNASVDLTMAFFSGDGETNSSNYQNNAMAKWFRDLGIDSSGTIYLPGGSTKKIALISINNTSGYWMPDYAADIATGLQALGTDTSAHDRMFIGALSGGVGRGYGYLSNDQSHNSPYRRCFTGGLFASGTSVDSVTANATSLLKVYIWSGGASDNGVQNYHNNMLNLYNYLHGTKRIGSTSGGGHSSTTWDDFFNITGADSSTNRFIWLLQVGTTNMNPTAMAGSDQVLTVPTTSSTLNGTGSFDDVSIASYTWTKLSGGSVTITSPSSATTTITGMSQGVYTFRLTVTDNTGLTGYDDIQVVISPVYETPARFYQTKEKPFLLTGPEYMMKPQRLVDNDTSTDWHTGDLNATLYAPFVAKFINDSCMRNMRLRIWPRYGATTVTFRFFNDLHTDSTDVTWTNSGNFTYNWVDTTTTKSIGFSVRSVELISTASYNIGEIEFYGNVVSGATVTKYFPEYNYIRNRTGQEFHSLGGNGDEPASMIAGMTYNFTTGKAVWYNDTATSIGSGAHKFVFNVFGNNVLSEYQAYVAAGLNIYTYNNQASGQYFGDGPKAPYTGGGSPYNYYAVNESQVKNMPLGADSLNPASWRENARLAAAHAIYYGTNSSANASGYDVSFSGGASATIGGGGLKALSIGNEIDADWVDKRRLHKPQVVIAMMSPAYDSAYAKDPNFEIWMGSQARPSLDKVKSYAWWSWRYRGYNNFPAKALPLNWYATTIGGQGSGGHGASPEAANFYREMVGFDTTVRRYLGNLKLTIQEYGYDASPNTNYSAITIGSKSRRVVSADWGARAYLLARAAGIDQMNWFRSLDLTNDLTAGADFATSGAGTGFNGTNPDSSFKYWPVGYMLGTLKSVMKNSIGKPQMINFGDSTSYTILKDTAVSGYDTCTYYAWMGTSNGSTSSVTINAPSGKTFSYIQRVDFKYHNGITEIGSGDLNGTRTTLTPASSIAFTATETPVMFRVVETSTGVVTPVIRSRKFRRIR